MNNRDAGPQHGLAGFQAGCRCTQCFSAESTRVRHIGRSEKFRWARINERADERWARRLPDEEHPHAEKRKARWTRDDIELALDTSISVHDIASILGRSKDAVETVRRRYRNHA